jgi:hypothetical protein
VLGNISKIEGNTVEFEGRKKSTFDAIVFATGYKSTANTWLKVPYFNSWSYHANKLIYATIVSFIQQCNFVIYGFRMVKAC